MEEDIKNLSEIIELCEAEINNNDENITAILDLTDLKSLRNLINRNKELKNSLVDMVNQFAYEDNNPKTKGSSLEKLYTGGLSALENAFNTLNIDEGIEREELWKLFQKE